MSNPRGDTVVRWTIVFAVIDTFAVILRIWARKKSGTKIAADDWMVMASLIPAYCMTVTASFFVTKGGAGKHRVDVTDSEMSLILKYLIPAMITYGLTITAVKISILLLYRRVFDTVNFKKAILVVSFLCIIWLCGNTFTMIFLCSPMSAAWDPVLVFSNHCRDFQAFLFGITISNLILDVVILCMPLPMIWNLNLSTRKKFELSGVFLLGSFTCIASLMRILSIDNIRDQDFSYTFLKTYLWSHIEPATAIWCACLMTYRPLFLEIDWRPRSVFGSGKPTSNNMKLVNSKKKDCSAGSSSNTWLSLEQNLRGQESNGYRDLSTRTAKLNVHVVDISMEPSPSDPRSSLQADDFVCTRIAVGREASLI